MKLFFHNKKPKDECAVFGIFNHKDAASLTVLGLHALQHRGQDSTGIVTSDAKNFFAHRGMGLKMYNHCSQNLTLVVWLSLIMEISQIHKNLKSN